MVNRLIIKNDFWNSFTNVMNIYELLKFVAVFNIPAVKDMKRAHLRHVSGCALRGVDVLSLDFGRGWDYRFMYLMDLRLPLASIVTMM